MTTFYAWWLFLDKLYLDIESVVEHLNNELITFRVNGPKKPLKSTGQPASVCPKSWDLGFVAVFEDYSGSDSVSFVAWSEFCLLTKRIFQLRRWWNSFWELLFAGELNLSQRTKGVPKQASEQKELYIKCVNFYRRIIRAIKQLWVLKQHQQFGHWLWSATGS